MFSAPVNLVAIFVAAVASMVVGYLWYSQALFGKAWMRLSGMKPDEGNKSMMMRSMLMSFVGTLVMSYILAHFIVYAGEVTALGGAKIAFWGWLGFVATTGANEYIFAVKPKPWELYCLNQGNLLAGLLVMGAILGAWQ